MRAAPQTANVPGSKRQKDAVYSGERSRGRLAVAVASAAALAIVVCLVAVWAFTPGRSARVTGPATLDASDQLGLDAASTKWFELLKNNSITDFCGLNDWHVRQGYQILRRQYSAAYPTSFDTRQSLRLTAVDQVERAALGKGAVTFSAYCLTAGVVASRFFVEVWAAEQHRDVEATRYTIQLAPRASIL